MALADKHNRELFGEIHRAIFVLCLDQPIPTAASESEKHTLQANQVQ